MAVLSFLYKRFAGFISRAYPSSFCAILLLAVSTGEMVEEEKEKEEISVTSRCEHESSKCYLIRRNRKGVGSLSSRKYISRFSPFSALGPPQPTSS